LHKIPRFLVFLMVAFSCSTLSACQGLGEETPPVAAKVASVAQAYPIALAEARNWKPDAYLTKVHAWVRRAEDSQPLSIDFLFESESDRFPILSVTCLETQTGFQTSVETYQYPPTKSTWRKPPVTSEYLTLDSAEVLNIGQRNGGSAFMHRQEKLGTERTAWYFLLLEWQPELEEVVWTACYTNVDGRESLYIFIDPRTGAVRKVIKQP